MALEPAAPDPMVTDLPARLRARVAPSLTDWLAWLGPQIDDGMLAEIAAADYGFNRAEHLVTLRGVRDERRVDGAVVWAASEVLELIRFSQPEDPAWSPGGQGRRGHLMRLFCCTLLVALADDPALRQYVDEEVTLRPLVASALALGEPAIDVVLPLLVARLPGLPLTDGERPFFALALLLLAAARYRQPDDGSLLADLCPWLIASEATARAAEYPSLLRPPWLLGLTFSAAGDDRWRDLAWRVLIEPAAPHPPAAAVALAEIGARLVLGEPDGPPTTPAAGV